MATALSDSDDGFQDFLSDGEEHETLLSQESVAMERRMKTLGIRDGLELSKEDTLQEGFDEGFALGAARSFRFGRLRGALGATSAFIFGAKFGLGLRLHEAATHTRDGHQHPHQWRRGRGIGAQELLQSVGVDISSKPIKTRIVPMLEAYLTAELYC